MPERIDEVRAAHALKALVLLRAQLQVDRGERGWKLAQIRGRRADQAGELTETPVSRRDRRLGAGKHQREAFGVVAQLGTVIVPVGVPEPGVTAVSFAVRFTAWP